jgi:hypothetical protein
MRATIPVVSLSIIVFALIKQFSAITSDLIKTLVTSEEYRMFQELELNPLVTFLDCLKWVAVHQ